MGNAKGERRRAEIVRAMVAHYDRTGVWPTMREVGDALGLPPSLVFWHLDRLAGAGYVDRIHNKMRATWVTDAGRAWSELEHL